MPSIDEVKMQKGIEDTKDIPVPAEDVEILVRTAIKLLNDSGGMQVIKEAIDTSQDPGQVVGQFITQLIAKMGEELGQSMNVDPRAFLAKGGFLEEILDYIEQQLGLPEEFSDQVYQEVLEMVKAIAQDPPPPNDVMGGGGVQGGPPPQQRGGLPPSGTPQPGGY